MPSNRLGMHWIRTHGDDATDFAFIRDAQPASIKLFEGMWSDWGFCESLKRALPAGCIILARDHPLSEQKEDMWRDPVGTGRRHADEWNEKVQRGHYWMPLEITYFLGINEPDATAGDRHAIDLYTTAFLDTLRSHGLKGGAFNFSTGHPRTLDGTGNTPPDYAFFEASHQAIVRGGHIAVQHIYGSADQPCVPGHFDRLKACPWTDVTWVIGECGIDEHVAHGGAHDGYLYALHPPQVYPQWIERLIRGANDPRIHSWQVFTYDFSHPWGSFDVRAVNAEFVSWGWQGYDPAQIVPAAEPVTVHLPIVGNGGQPAPQPAPEEQPVTAILDPLVLEAILQIESGGRSLGDDKRPIIRFEAHIFKQQLGNNALFDQHFRFGAPIWTGQQMLVDGEWKDIHVGSQAREWQAFEKAATLDYEAAAQSISMGAPQIMGFNHASIGYPSATAMLEAFGEESIQTIAFINFILGRQSLVLAVRNKDWREIARIYNGAGNVDQYAPLLQGAYTKLKERA